MSEIELGPATLSQAPGGGAYFTGLPLSGPVTAVFGSSGIPEHAGGHTGVDIAAATGTPVRAPAPGVVTETATGSGVFGNFVVLAHAGGWKTLYAHLSHLQVARGARVLRGGLLGLSGNTGLSTGPHLHLGLALAGEPSIRGPHLRDPLRSLAAAPGLTDAARTYRGVAAALFGALQAAGALIDSETEADLVLYPAGSPERDILAIQRAANGLIARYLPEVTA